MIHRTQEVINVIFGSNVDGTPTLSTCPWAGNMSMDNRPVAGFEVQQIKILSNDSKIGDVLAELKYECLGPRYRFAFAKTESIDIIIEALQKAKSILNVANTQVQSSDAKGEE